MFALLGFFYRELLRRTEGQLSDRAKTELEANFKV